MKNNMKKQQGAALVVGLIFLVILTLMAYTSMKGTILQEKMAAGLHNRTLAHSGANSALRSGESFLYNLIEETNGVNVTGTTGGDLFKIFSRFENPLDPENSPFNQKVEAFKKTDWSSADGTEHDFNFSAVHANAALSNNPQYLIQEVFGVPFEGLDSQEFGGGNSDGSIQKGFYIYAKSESGDGKTMSLVQSMFSAVVSSSPNN